MGRSVPLRAQDLPPEGGIHWPVRLQHRQVSGELVEEDQPGLVVVLVGRVDQGEIPTAAPDALEEAVDGTRHHGGQLGQTGGGKVGLERGPSGAVLVDEGGVGGAARQRFDAEGTAAGEKVEHGRADDRAQAPERVERGLPHSLGCGAGRRPPRGDQPSSSGRAGDHAHGRRRYRPGMTEPAPPDGVVVIRIDQGHVRNAINTDTAARLHDAFLAFEDDPAARVAVLTGDAAAFCAGANLRDLPKLRASGPLGPTRLQLSKPVIAAIEGWCVAGGVELAAWCDLRVAGRSARIGCLERRWGVPLIDGGTYRLPQIVGLGRALDLILTGREIGTDEAERMGFLTRVVPDGEALAAALALAAEIASFPWRGVVNDRTSVYAGLGRGLEEALLVEEELGKDTIFAEGFAAGVDRFNDHQAQRDH